MSTFISLDGTIANIGMIIGTFGPLQVIAPKDGILFKTAPTKNKKIPKSEDYLNRCNYLYMQVNNLVTSIKPNYVFLEGPTGSQDANSAKSIGAIYMLAGAIKANISKWDGELVIVTPIAVKKASVGSNTASKEEMLSWAVDKYPDFPFYKSKRGEVYAYNEHLADAIAVAHAGVKKILEGDSH
jgi:Holliday junction resolvasome RuvABC endonuclease subunit